MSCCVMPCCDTVVVDSSGGASNTAAGKDAEGEGSEQKEDGSGAKPAEKSELQVDVDNIGAPLPLNSVDCVVCEITSGRQQMR